MNPVTRLIKKFGTQDRLAKAAERSQPQVGYWEGRGYIPKQVERNILRNAPKLGVDVSPEDFFDLPEDGEAA